MYTDKAAAERFLEDNGFIFRKEREKKRVVSYPLYSTVSCIPHLSHNL